MYDFFVCFFHYIKFNEMHHSHRSQSVPLILKFTNFAVGAGWNVFYRDWQPYQIFTPRLEKITRNYQKNIRKESLFFFLLFAFFPYPSVTIITHTLLCTVELFYFSKKSSIHICIFWLTTALVHLVTSLREHWLEETHHHISPLLVSRDNTY